MNDPSCAVPDDNSLARTRSPGLSNGIAVAGGKGGIGKTWFSITLAHALARRSRRVLLFDGDIGLANVDIQLGFVPRFTLVDVIQAKQPLARAVQVYPKGGFDLVAGQSGSGGVMDLTGSAVDSLVCALGTVSPDYGHVILDLASSIDCHTLRFAEECRTIMVLTTDEPTALTDAYAFIKLLARAKPDADIRIVVNLAHSLREGERTYETLLRACRNFLKLSPPLAAIVRIDRAVRDAIRNQIPLLVRAPHCDAAGTLVTLADQLILANPPAEADA